MLCCCYSSASGSDGGAYAVLTGTLPAPAVPDSFSRRFPLHSNDNHPTGSGSSSEEKDQEKEPLVMGDMRYAAPRASVGGQWATFTGFEHRKDEEACIDFVFGRSDRVGWCVPCFSFCLDEWRSHLTPAGRRKACLSRRPFRTMGCSRVTTASSSPMSSFF